MDECNNFGYRKRLSKSQGKLEKLDKILRYHRCETNRPNGGINIIFIGDFHQLLPFGGGAEALYNNYCIHLINTAVFLINDHHFSARNICT